MKLVIFGLTVSSSWGNGHATLWRGLCSALGNHGHRVVFFERDVPYYAAHRDLTELAGGDLVLYQNWESILPCAGRDLADADAAIVTSYCPDGVKAAELILSSNVPLRVFYDLDTPVTLRELRSGKPVDYLPPHGLGDFDLVLSYTGGKALDELRDVCDFQQLRSGSALLESELSEPWTSDVSVQEVCPVLVLPREESSLRAHVPAHILQKLAHYRRRAAREGPLESLLATEETFDDFFDVFLKLHLARWSAKGVSGVLEDSSLQRFHSDAAKQLLRAGALRLHILRLGNSIIAALYAFHSGRRTYHYLSGFDPAFASISPGTLIIGAAIEHAVTEGAAEFDFLRGREGYKYLWGAKGRLNCRRQLARGAYERKSIPEGTRSQHPEPYMPSSCRAT